jgi:spermidine synthase
VPLAVRLSLLAFGVTGFANMLMQIAWTKAIVLSIGNSTYAFSLIVTLFILGIAVGGAAASLVADRARNLPLLLGVLVTATAALMSITIPLLGHFPIVASRAFDAVAEPSYGAFLAINVRWVAAMLLPSTILMGTVFPIVGKIRARAIEKVGSAVGSAYFWNTTGSILGTLAAGFVFIPLLGEVYWTLYLGAGISLSMGLLLVAASLDRGGFPVKGLAAALAAGAAIVVPHGWFLPHGVHGSEKHYWHPSIMSRGAYVYFHGTYRDPKGNVIPEDVLIRGLIASNEVLYYKEGIHAPVAVVKSPKGEVAMRISGKVEASFLPGGDFNSDQPHQILAGHLPMILHPSPKRVLTLGLGGGVTLGTIVAHDIESVDSLEISPEVIAAARDYFGEVNRDALKDLRVRNVVGDGRNHLEYTPRRFDVITSVPSNPWIAGIGNLFTVEFFRTCRERLTPGGVMCNWIHKINMRADDFRTVVRTFLEAFGDTAQLWDLGYDALLIGGTGPVVFDPGRFTTVLGSPEVAKDLGVLGITSAETLLRHYHFDAEALRQYCGSRGPRNTDAFPVLEFECPYGLYGHQLDAFASLAMARHAALPPAWTGSTDEKSVASFQRTRDAFHRFQLASTRLQAGMEIIADLKELERDTLGGDVWLRGQVNALAAQAFGAAPAQPTLEATLAMGLASQASQAQRSREERAAILAQAAPYARDNTRCVLEVARLALELDPTLGIPVVEAALVKSPRDARLLLSLGVLLGVSQRLEPAVRTLEEGLKHASEPPLRSELHQNLAIAYQGLGRMEEAAREYERALEQNPGNATARARLEQLRQASAGK